VEAPASPPNRGSTEVRRSHATLSVDRPPVPQRPHQRLGQSGNDTIRLDGTNGPLPASSLFGGSGNDVLLGGILLNGEAVFDS
jgi:hypothetical protein